MRPGSQRRLLARKGHFREQEFPPLREARMCGQALRRQKDPKSMGSRSLSQDEFLPGLAEPEACRYMVVLTTSSLAPGAAGRAEGRVREGTGEVPDSFHFLGSCGCCVCHVAQRLGFLVFHGSNPGLSAEPPHHLQHVHTSLRKESQTHKHVGAEREAMPVAPTPLLVNQQYPATTMVSQLSAVDTPYCGPLPSCPIGASPHQQQCFSP
ncbi:uncharacterized protein LOC130859148 [Hippopotamus amphibius kiboko]|uniref:uncharacterized protein LOC130859148 n=1 Tax=Hippopotamus amphibius kiboko TaxID=575201 RepID=UPI002591346C|nr:uncharacterized protein LOC130859148 [Hippopotamus amphibius kiboko]